MQHNRPITKQEALLPALLNTTQRSCKEIQDSVTRKVRISLTDCLMSGVAMFGLKYPSLLQFDQETREADALLQHNLKSLYGIEHVPSDTYFRERLDKVESKEPQIMIDNILSLLKQRKIFEKYKYIDDYYLVSLDATGNFSSHDVSCECCCVKKHRDGTSTYYHQTLAAVMVNPNYKTVFPLAIEPITKQDGNTKNDCEHNAAKRLLQKLRDSYPDMKIIVVMDGLYADGPMVTLLKSLDMRFIITAKKKDLSYLFNEYSSSEQKKSKITLTKGHTLNLSFVEKLPLNYSYYETKVNLLECADINKKKSTVFTWITDLPLSVSRQMTKKIVFGGRARWKIENETFNTLKNQGYNFEHNYGHGKQNLCTILTYLMFVAFLIDQAQEFCCSYFKASLERCISRIRLWEKLRALFFHYFVNTWEQAYTMLSRSGLGARLEDIIADSS